MTNCILRLFVRNYRQTDDPAVRVAYGKVAGLVGIVTNLLLATAKLLAGILFHSISMTADAVNNFSDSASSIVTMVGFHIASKPADKDHPHGHARMEYIAGLIVSVIILFLGFELGRSSVEKIFTPEESEFGIVAVIVLGGSILGKLWQCLFYRKLGKAIQSTALKATAADSRNDVVATAVVLAGGVITWLTGFNLDGYLGVAVALFIFFSGIQLIRETVNPLLGTAPEAELLEQLHALFSSREEILNYHDLLLHDYGGGAVFATVHFEMDGSQTLAQAHGLIDALERQVKQAYGITLVVHPDPAAVGDPRTQALQKQVLALVQEIDPTLRLHDFQVQWDSVPIVSFDLSVPYDCKQSDTQLCALVEEKLQTLGQLQLQIVVDRCEETPCNHS